MAIGFLASLLGLGDPSKPVKETIEKAQSPVNKAIDWVIHGAVKLVKAAGNVVKGLFGRKNKEQRTQHEDDPAKATKITRPLSMSGTSHQLTTAYADGSISTTLATRDAKSVLTIVDNEAGLHAGLAATSPEPARSRHSAIAIELSSLRPKYDSEAARIRAMTDKSKIRDEIVKLNNEVTQWIIDVANRHGLHDFLRKALHLDPVIERIRIQIEDQLEKHIRDQWKPENPGDGHANTATAAELYLLWVHHTGQRHGIKTTVARDVIRQALDELKSLQNLGLDLLTIPMYQRGMRAQADCEKALTNPKGYLDAKGGLEAQFIADIRAQRARGVTVGASWIT